MSRLAANKVQARSGSSTSSGSTSCPFHHLHSNLAKLQKQGGGFLASQSQPACVVALLLLLLALALAYVAYRVALALFAKRFKVPPKGGAIVITGKVVGDHSTRPTLSIHRSIDGSIDRLGRHHLLVSIFEKNRRRLNGHREPRRRLPRAARLRRVCDRAEAGGRRGAQRLGPRDAPAHHHGRGQAGG